MFFIMFIHMACFHELACGGGHKWPAIFLPCLASILCTMSLQIRQFVLCCVLSCIPQLLVESAPGLACECSKLCDSPELRSYGCRVLCIRASLSTNPLSGEVPQCLPHLHQPACKNPTIYKLNMKFILRILRF